jgi:recombination associated protein RdgC
MWFKNLCLYRFTEPFTLGVDELAEKLEPLRFKPCGAHEEASAGWVAPLGTAPDALIHAANGYLMVCLKKQEKVLPSAVVNELLQEKIAEEEQESGRKLGRKARTQLKDELLFSLLPKAFTFSRRNYAFIDPQGGWLVVDSASANKAEDLLFLLRKAIGSLSVVLPKTAENPTRMMTQWLLGQDLPANITIEDECELQAQGEGGGVIRCKRHDLSLPEIQNHLNSGKEVTRLAVNWANRLGFVIDKTLTIKRLRFLDLIQDQLKDTDIEDEATRFDVEFTIMAAELSAFLPELMACFGGAEITPV